MNATTMEWMNRYADGPIANDPLVRTEIIPTGFTVRVETPAALATSEIDGRPFCEFDLEDDYTRRIVPARCTHHLDDVVGYVVFDNDVWDNGRGVTRTDLRLFEGATSYGAAVDFARLYTTGTRRPPFSRGIGMLCRCGWRSY